MDFANCHICNKKSDRRYKRVTIFKRLPVDWHGFMASGKGIVGLIITLVSVFSLIGYMTYASDMMQGASRLSQGDQNALNDMTETTVDYAVGELYWAIGIAVAITICSALGLGFLVKILSRV